MEYERIYLQDFFFWNTCCYVISIIRKRKPTVFNLNTNGNGNLICYKTKCVNKNMCFKRIIPLCFIFLVHERAYTIKNQ